MTKRKVPNVVRGGKAIPLKGKTNYYYMQGRKHSSGGIDIGENPRTGLEVEDGEVMHVADKEIKVFSSVPFLNGKSPAQKVMGGENPTKVFNQQEEFKDKHNMNDDGTKKKRMGGLSRNKDYGSKSKPYPNIKSEDFAGGGRSYPIPTKADAVDALRLAGLHGRSDVKAKVYSKYPELRKKSKAGGVYTVTSNGKTSLRMIPSTGDLLRRDKAKLGKYGKIDVSTALSNRGKIEYNFASLNKNRKDNEYKNDSTIVSHENTLINNKPPYRAERNINLFDDGAAIKSGLINAGWSHGNTKKSDNIEIPNMDFSLVDKYYPKTNKNNVINNNVNKRKQIKNNVSTNPPINSSTNRPTITPIRPNLASMAKPMDNSTFTMPIIKTSSTNKNYNILDNNYVDKKQNNISDGIGLTSNIVGSLLSHAINRNMLNKLKYSDQPIARNAAKLKTNININPQLDKMRETLAAYERDIDNNTASSRVALARKQRARLANMLQTNELFGNKENIETELINKDRLNQQTVTDANIRDYNTWSEKKAAFENAVREKKAENDVSLINILNAGVQDVIGRREKRKSERQTRLAMAAANPNVNPRILRDLGIKGITDADIDRWEKAFAKKKKKDNDNED